MQQQDKKHEAPQTTTGDDPMEGGNVENESKKAKTDAGSSQSPPGQQPGAGKDDNMEDGDKQDAAEAKDDKKEDTIQDIHEKLSKFTGASAKAKTKSKGKQSSG